MNRDDIIRMAREADGHAYTNRHMVGEPAFAFSIDRLERFAALVAAAEREACAKVVEAGTGQPIQTRTLEILRQERERIAFAIRERGAP